MHELSNSVIVTAPSHLSVGRTVPAVREIGTLDLNRPRDRRRRRSTAIFSMAPKFASHGATRPSGPPRAPKTSRRASSDVSARPGTSEALPVVRKTHGASVEAGWLRIYSHLPDGGCSLTQVHRASREQGLQKGTPRSMPGGACWGRSSLAAMARVEALRSRSNLWVGGLHRPLPFSQR